MATKEEIKKLEEAKREAEQHAKEAKKAAEKALEAAIKEGSISKREEAAIKLAEVVKEGKIGIETAKYELEVAKNPRKEFEKHKELDKKIAEAGNSYDKSVGEAEKFASKQRKEREEQDKLTEKQESWHQRLLSGDDSEITLKRRGSLIEIRFEDRYASTYITGKISPDGKHITLDEVQGDDKTSASTDGNNRYSRIRHRLEGHTYDLEEGIKDKTTISLSKNPRDPEHTGQNHSITGELAAAVSFISKKETSISGYSGYKNYLNEKEIEIGDNLEQKVEKQALREDLEKAERKLAKKEEELRRLIEKEERKNTKGKLTMGEAEPESEGLTAGKLDKVAAEFHEKDSPTKSVLSALEVASQKSRGTGIGTPG